ncbi:hypothetical protein [Granulicatella elegans]|uniref:hypothetical protein n=1 Tax=Granulicatella elegans TaxID=137732 RepID=UPI001D147A4C|nr:hypothetical protein [Granulicatella elegans]UEA31929.1 hypothetical protein LK443_03015 [Granulicatella elegans]
MKFKNKVISSFLLVSALVTPIVAYAAKESLDGGSGTWLGGIDNHVVYSKVWDNKVDGRRYHVTVWVKDDNGDKDELTGTTYGVKEAGEVKITKTASYDHWFTPNKAGYKNFSVITNYSMDYNEMDTAPTPAELEVNLWDELQ